MICHSVGKMLALSHKLDNKKKVITIQVTLEKQ